MVYCLKFSDYQFVCLVEWIIDWLIGWLMDGWIDLTVDWFTDWLIDWLIDWKGLGKKKIKAICHKFTNFDVILLYFINLVNVSFIFQVTSSMHET